MKPGTPFVYYRGRRALALGLPGPGYFGSGVVGDALQTTDGRTVSEIVDVIAFDHLVALRDPVGRYYEPLAHTQRGYWRTGVRAIEAKTMARILAAASEPPPKILLERDTVSNTTTPNSLVGAVTATYGSNFVLNAEVERYAVDLTLTMLRAEYGTTAVVEMPRNNRGYDILVHAPTRELHVEVKGTRSHEAVFFLTEGERLHSTEPDIDFMLVVVHAINLGGRTHRLACRRGPVDESAYTLKARQWESRLVLNDGWPANTL